MRKADMNMWRFALWGKKHYALLPLVGFTVGACALCGAYVVYMATMKTDVSWTPSKYDTSPPYKDMGTNWRRFMPESRPLNHAPEDVMNLRKEIVQAYQGK